MMAEEFNESDIVFTGSNLEDCLNGFADLDSDELRRSKRKKVDRKTKKTKAMSVPVNVTWSCGYMERRRRSLYEYEEEEEDGEMMVPPHVMARRRMAEKMAFSVCYGMGRTLKGRDLSEMRNSVLRMTGFLET
ncbi:hypothetical protein QVD17_21926 [Tagetes erecta]|uniref:Senescence regulator n=1 Tax=Tagetes erecta TaxID=13708 RepID=A0AAD8KFK0_TARER|nr:hypothetical protein QVD17_21926 [Tagetes erecta]